MIGNSSTKKPFFAWKVLRNIQTITKNNYRVHIEKKRNKSGNWKWKWKVWAETTPSSTSDGCRANQNWFFGGETNSAPWRKVKSPRDFKFFIPSKELLTKKLSDDVEALKNQEKHRLSELSKYNSANAIDKLTAKIEKSENESNDILVENMINAQDAVDCMAEETTKLLNAEIEERLRQIKLIDEQIQSFQINWFII